MTGRHNPVELDGQSLDFASFSAVVFDGSPAQLAPSARERMKASRAVIEQALKSGRAIYGVNTGFGRLASTRIPPAQISALQLNLVRSHACGVGEPLSEAETRAVLLLRANALAKGFSGVRPLVAEKLCDLLNRGVHPLIPSQGSAGASGDLAPLAHVAQVLLGEGQVVFECRTMAAGDALQTAGVAPLRLEAKEGLALLNGTQAMLALLALALLEAEAAVDTADVAAALSLDALRGSPDAFDPRISAARPYAGQMLSARNLLRLNRGSEIRESHRSAERDPRVQDPYSLRCAPQVHGAVRDSLSFIRSIVLAEMNSATDNPLVFAGNHAVVGSAAHPRSNAVMIETDILSGGNFHGQPLAMAADHMAIALSALAGISERRIEQMTNPSASQLPAFLVRDAGLQSGFMVAQVVAASLAAEMRAMAAPHSVHSIPTSANQEDFVSMGMGAARRLAPMLANLRRVLAIELLAACQGLDFLAPLRTGIEARAACERVRALSHPLDGDRSLSADIEAVAEAIWKQNFRISPSSARGDSPDQPRSGPQRNRTNKLQRRTP